MRWLKLLSPKPELSELMNSTARNVVGTVAGLYLVWHIIATIGYPAQFSPSLWLISFLMFALVAITLRLSKSHYLLSQILWLSGLMGAIFLGYHLYRFPGILYLLLILPLLSTVTVGLPITALTILGGTAMAVVLAYSDGFSKTLPATIFLGGIFSAIFGWGVSNNLLEALNAAAYHYNEARRLLEETRAHRAEISRMLKDRNQVNYQLERMNEMLAIARAQAEEARENRNRFMLAVSHELRSPLNFIIGFSDLMVNVPETYAPLEHWPPGLYDDIQEIYTSSRHLMRLINDILDMGKIDARQMQLFREKAHLPQVIADVTEMIRGAFEQKGIALNVEIPPDLPPVFIDTTRIRQVLLNLLNNGLRFTDQGSVTLRVEKQEQHLLISVQDTGTGIAPEDLPKVFSEFRQVGDENWRRRAGSGLGLYISRQFIELHGGKMDVESVLGQGTRFYFTLPLSSLPPEIPEIVATETPPRSEDNRLLLLVTPRKEDLQRLQHEMDDYVLHQARSPQEAIGLCKRLFPRAILLTSDAEHLQTEKLPYDLPVVRFSLPHASMPPGNIRRQLVKPVSRKMLMEAIHTLGPKAERLLIVDDDPAMVRFVMQALRADKSPNHYTLLTAFTGNQALDILASTPVDAILLDLELPDIHGWEVLARLRQKEALSDLPVIIISAQDLPDMNFVPGTNALELTLRRPLRLPELTRVVKSTLEIVQPVYPGGNESSGRGRS
jgi:signal transduction histidine kinase/CheY-like chemotaxis protein